MKVDSQTEIERLRQQLEDAHEGRVVAQHELAAWKSDAEKAEARVAELEADGKRLDWLEHNAYVAPYLYPENGPDDLTNWRGAIDAAREKGE